MSDNFRLRMNIGNDDVPAVAGGTDGKLTFIHSLLDQKLFFNKGDIEISIPGGGSFNSSSGICSPVETKDKPLGRVSRHRIHEIKVTSRTQTPNYILKKAQVWMGKTGWSWQKKEKGPKILEGDTNNRHFKLPQLQDGIAKCDIGQKSS